MSHMQLILVTSSVIPRNKEAPSILQALKRRKLGSVNLNQMELMLQTQFNFLI